MIWHPTGARSAPSPLRIPPESAGLVPPHRRREIRLAGAVHFFRIRPTRHSPTRIFGRYSGNGEPVPRLADQDGLGIRSGDPQTTKRSLLVVRHLERSSCSRAGCKSANVYTDITNLDDPHAHGWEHSRPPVCGGSKKPTRGQLVFYFAKVAIAPYLWVFFENEKNRIKTGHQRHGGPQISSDAAPQHTYAQIQATPHRRMR